MKNVIEKHELTAEDLRNFFIKLDGVEKTQKTFSDNTTFELILKLFNGEFIKRKLINMEPSVSNPAYNLVCALLGFSNSNSPIYVMSRLKKFVTEPQLNEEYLNLLGPVENMNCSTLVANYLYLLCMQRGYFVPETFIPLDETTKQIALNNLHNTNINLPNDGSHQAYVYIRAINTPTILQNIYLGEGWSVKWLNSKDKIHNYPDRYEVEERNYRYNEAVKGKEVIKRMIYKGQKNECKAVEHFLLQYFSQQEDSSLTNIMHYNKDKYGFDICCSTQVCSLFKFGYL